MYSSDSYSNVRCTATDAGGGQCGQYLSFDVLRDFKKLYEKKLDEIDRDGGGDCLELKNLVQKKWIEDLTEQTEMMAKVIKELENEATERVKKLEEKLDQSAKCACAVMKRYQSYDFSIDSDETFQKPNYSYLESDIRNLLEFIGRIRDEGRWSIDGLQFYNVEYSDLFGDSPNYNNKRTYERGTTPRDKESIPINGNNNDDEATRLGKELEYLKSFGNIEEISRELKRKNAEFDALRQAMFDMRAALTEEVACKHDMISALRKDTQQLEERCLQADKQTAFKDDIIKELRKEIKQMKQQDHVEKEEVAEMKKKIAKLTSDIQRLRDEQNVIEFTTNCENIDSICDGDATVCFENCNCSSCKKLKSTTVECDSQETRIATRRQRVTDCNCSDNCIRKELRNKNEIIQVQNDTLEMLQNQLQACKEREVKLIEEIHVKESEIHDLRTKCENLEHALVHMQERAENLERAVDLYSNSVNVLEATEGKSRIEIEQLRVTIANLQEALIDAKHELDELREKSLQDMEHQQYLINVLYVNLLDIEKKKEFLNSDLGQTSVSYKNLQDANFELEIEHLNSLQDVSILETQLAGYQNEFRIKEDQTTKLKNEIKKLRHEKRVYEQVVVYFKGEMGVMSEQLKNLQEILQMSTKTTKEENVQLSKNVNGLQEMNLRLRNELINTEQRLQKGSWQMQVKEARISELEAMVVKKNEELDMHDEAVRVMRKKLENSILQNHKLEGVIQALNTTVMQLQLNNKTLELEIADKSKSEMTMCSLSVAKITKDLKRKNEKLEQLMEEHCAQTRIFEATKRELEKIKRELAIDKTNEANIKRKYDEIKCKMCDTEHRNQKLRDDLTNIYAQVEQLGKRERARENELLQYKNTCSQLKESLNDLNQHLHTIKQENMSLKEKVKKHHNEGKQQDSFTSEVNSAKQTIKELEQENQSLKKAAGEQVAKFEHMEKQFSALRREIKVHVEKLHKAQRALADAQVENSSLKKDIEHKDGRALGIKKIYEELQVEKQCICLELKKKDAEINNLKMRCAQCNNNDSDERQATMEQMLQQSQEEAKRFSQMVNQLRQEVYRLTTLLGQAENQNNMPSAQCICKQQLENEALKREIQSMINNQMALNAENDKLLREVSELQSVLASLQAENDRLTQQIKELSRQNKELVNEKNEIYNELKCIECCYRDLEKDHKSIAASMQCLEKELRSTRTNRNDLCAESKHVINNVKLWLKEQKKINEQNQMQSKNYLNTIDQLKKENKRLLDQLRMNGASPLATSATCTCNERSLGNGPRERVGTKWYSDAPESDMSDGKNINWLSAAPYQAFANDHYEYSDGKETYPSPGYSTELCECSPGSSPGSTFDDGLSSLMSCSIEEYYWAPNYQDDEETDLTDDYTKRSTCAKDKAKVASIVKSQSPDHNYYCKPSTLASKNQSKSPQHAYCTSPESNNCKCQSKNQHPGHSSSPESNNYKTAKDKNLDRIGNNQNPDCPDKCQSPDASVGKNIDDSIQSQPNKKNGNHKDNNKSLGKGKGDPSKSSPDRNGGSSPDRNGRSSPDRNSRSSPDRNGRSSPDRNGGSSPDRNGGSSPDRKGRGSPDRNGRSSPDHNGRSSPDRKGKSNPDRKGKNNPGGKVRDSKDSSGQKNRNKNSDGNNGGKSDKKKDCKCPFRATDWGVYRVPGQDCRCKSKKK